MSKACLVFRIYSSAWWWLIMRFSLEPDCSFGLVVTEAVSPCSGWMLLCAGCCVVSAKCTKLLMRESRLLPFPSIRLLLSSSACGHAELAVSVHQNASHGRHWTPAKAHRQTRLVFQVNLPSWAPEAHHEVASQLQPERVLFCLPFRIVCKFQFPSCYNR